jgi:hypothetical protein
LVEVVEQQPAAFGQCHGLVAVPGAVDGVGVGAAPDVHREGLAGVFVRAVAELPTGTSAGPHPQGLSETHCRTGQPGRA